MLNLENHLDYAHWQYDTIRHLLALTVAVFAAGFVYFLATARETAPRYRLSSTISAVVMVSATLEIFQLWLGWTNAFSFDRAAGLWRSAAASPFSNGYRYVNWSIDVPMLLTQVLVVLGFTGAEFWRRWWRLATAGLFMIWTGYVGQFYEPPVAGLPQGWSGDAFWIWFAISTAFYLYVLYELRRAIGSPAGEMPGDASREFGRIWFLILGSWTLYPVAYLVPAFWADGNGILLRQVAFTVADITSKLVFGVMLSRAARFRSAHEGWEPAIAADPGTAPGRPEPVRLPGEGHVRGAGGTAPGRPEPIGLPGEDRVRVAE